MYLRTCVIASYLALELTTQAISPKSLCLQQPDVPKGFIQIGSHWVTNTDLAKLTHLPSSVFADRFGRISGYETEYRRYPAAGLFHIRDTISQFKSVRGARAFDDANARGARVDTRLGARYESIPAPHVGDHATAFTAKIVYRGYKYREFLIYFEKRTYSVALQVEGGAGTFRLEDVNVLAKKIDSRLEKTQKQDQLLSALSHNNALGEVHTEPPRIIQRNCCRCIEVSHCAI